MEEIQIFLDKELTEEVEDNIIFPQIIAGNTTIKNIYIKNIINYTLNVKLTLDGEFITISKTIDKLLKDQVAEIKFEITPKITIMKPIKANLKIKIDYVVV